MIVVEHDMDFLRRFADSVTVLHAGRVLSEGTVAQVQQDSRVQEVYLGRPSAGPALVAEANAQPQPGFESTV